MNQPETDTVSAGRRRAPDFLYLAAAAAVILTIATVAGTLFNRITNQTAVPAHPQASPLTNYGPPPAGVPLLYLVDPRNKAWLQGYDWSGKARGTVDLTPDALTSPGGVLMAPDGSAFEVGVARKGASGVFLDRLGRPIPVQAAPYITGSMWADDGGHQCQMTLDPQTYTWGLSTQLPGEAVKPVAVIAQDQGVGQSGISLAACSSTHDVAILVRYSIAWPSELWVVRISDGTVLSHRTYGSEALATVIASPDGAYIAESSSKSSGFTGPGADATVIRRVSDWSVVFSIDASVAVLGFSGDASHVLISKTPLTSGVSSHLEIIDWQARHGIWNYDGPEALDRFLAQPHSGDFALAFDSTPTLARSACPKPPAPGCAPVEDPLRDVLIVHADGSTTKIPGRFLTTW
jgi:hypothetical protein